MANHNDPGEPLPGQMTVDECIEVAEKGLDGKGDETRMSHPLSVAEVVRRRMEQINGMEHRS
jgi:hypothetical protein